MGPSGPIIQVNLNHSTRAQDLLMQTVVEWGAGLAVVAEPYRVPDHAYWMGDLLDSAAIVWSGRPGTPPLALLERGKGFLAVDSGGIAVVAIYAPPSWSFAIFKGYLSEVGRCISRCLPRPVLILGDFNSKAQGCGSLATDARGHEVIDWAAGLELPLLNTDSVHMCVRKNGGSIGDLSWASPAAARRFSGGEWRLRPNRYQTTGTWSSASPPTRVPTDAAQWRQGRHCDGPSRGSIKTP
ncbi:uncharacterized protein LOC128879931 [Hylaeus volcanicus]|uniref:uncharacterized protein LOC128879931 n=1 Tax=Hylaeus volcanicus TaxID=313075 RepID=UPI0023B8504B|nr:uncharacterized protein LOC128879931 [Hylaeus volcanicus]